MPICFPEPQKLLQAIRQSITDVHLVIQQELGVTKTRKHAKHSMREMNIRTTLRVSNDEELVLLAMQRPFVWEEDCIGRLMDSLMRTFPIGAVLIWETDAAQRFRHFTNDAHAGEQPLVNFPEVEGKRLKYVLDGQQRLTSLNIAAHGSLDGRRLHLDLLSGDALDNNHSCIYN